MRPWIRCWPTGEIWNVQLDTYVRELERYGGATGMPLCERIFQADSEAVLSIVEALSGDAGADARWRLALAGIDRLHDDIGFDLPARLALYPAAPRWIRPRDAVRRAPRAPAR